MINYSGYWKSVPRSRVRAAFGKLVLPRKLLHTIRFVTIHKPPFTLSSSTINGLFENICRPFIYLKDKNAERFLSG
jgi:hypothetical protein